MSKSELVETVRTVANPEDNGGEHVILSADIFDNGDDSDNVYVGGSITLESYGRSATINIGGVTPQMFRAFADMLEEAIDRNTRDKK